MKHKLEKAERYAFIGLEEDVFTNDIPKDFETLSRKLFSEGSQNLILHLQNATEIDADGLGVLRKINSLSTHKLGIFILVTDSASVVELLENQAPAIEVLPTKEEAIDAVFMHDLENSFSSGEDDFDEDDYDRDEPAP